MSQFSIKPESVGSNVQTFRSAADTIRKCSTELEEIKENLDPSLMEVAPALTAVAAEAAANADGVDKLAEALSRIVQLVIDTESRVIEYFKASAPVTAEDTVSRAGA